MNTLKELQKWYLSQCDGDWEHGYGVKIDTLDNPGWRVIINIVDTPLEGRPFTEVKRLEHSTDWIQCRVRDGKFEGHGGPLMLEEILRLFLAWATLSDTVTRSNIPQSVASRQGGFRCVRISDGRFHLVWPGPLVDLFYGADHILASENLAEILRETCSHCLDLRRTEIVQIATGESFGTYFEVIPRDEITPANVNKIRADGFHLWRYGRSHLFVTQAVADVIRKRGFDEISFSQGFSHFAAAIG